MKKTEAEAFLTVNKVEEGIRCAADAGAIMFAVLIEARNSTRKSPTQQHTGSSFSRPIAGGTCKC